jgi:hypothetical protein
MTPNTTEELLCGGPHNNSNAIAGPDGGISVRRSSIGSMNRAWAEGKMATRMLQYAPQKTTQRLYSAIAFSKFR